MILEFWCGVYCGLCNIEPSCFALDWFYGCGLGTWWCCGGFPGFGVSDLLMFGCCYAIVLVVFGFCVWFLIVAGALWWCLVQ